MKLNHFLYYLDGLGGETEMRFTSRAALEISINLKRYCMQVHTWSVHNKNLVNELFWR